MVVCGVMWCVCVGEEGGGRRRRGGVCGARDLENGVSVQARFYMHLIKRQQELLQGYKRQRPYLQRQIPGV